MNQQRKPNKKEAINIRPGKQEMRKINALKKLPGKLFQ